MTRDGRSRRSRRERRAAEDELLAAELAEDRRIAAMIDGKMRVLLDTVARAGRKYSRGELDWLEFDGVIQVYSAAADEGVEIFARPREELLEMVEREARGDVVWDPAEAAARALAELEDDEDDDLDSESLGEAVETISLCASEAGRIEMVRSAEDWSELVLRYLPSSDIAAFIRAAITFEPDDEADVQHWTSHLRDIWNNMPQPDRGGKTAREIFAEGEH